MGESVKVKYAKIEDIDVFESHANALNEKMGTKDMGLSYDKETFLSKAKYYIESEDFVVLKCVENNKIIGGLFACFMPQLFSDKHTVLQEFALQSDPSLSDMKQAKIIISLIKYLEDIAVDIEADLVAISFMEQYDLSKHLTKKGYEKSDIIYVRRVK
jgi:hypothetical protein